MASHFFGVGFIVDAALIAIGFVFLGWAIFKAVRDLWKCFELVKDATSLEELDAAAVMLGKVLATLGFETLLAVVSYGVLKLAKPAANAVRKGTDAIGDWRKARRTGDKADDAIPPKRKKKPVRSRTEIIDERIKTDPKFAKHIEKDVDAVYGYKFKEGSPFKKWGINFHDKKSVESARRKRKKYLDELRQKEIALKKKIADIKASGKSLEELAEAAVKKRNQDRIDSYIKEKNVKKLEELYERNLGEGWPKEGPTVEFYLKQGKTYEDIILSSVKDNHAFSAVLGLWP